MAKLGVDAEGHGYKSESSLITVNEFTHDYKSGTLAYTCSS
jgi:hypothetical protein